MAAAGAVVAEALRAVAEQARPGQSTTQLDEVAADVLAGHGARSPCLNYHPAWAPRPFPAVLCVSVHDPVSIDFGATLRGWCGDAARSFIVGTPRPEDASLIAATDNALAAGIAAARPGNTLGDIGHAIASAARCTRIRTCRTKGARARACRCDPVW